MALYSDKIPVAKKINGKIYTWRFSFDTKEQARAWVKSGRKVGHLRRVFKIQGRYRGYSRKA